MDTKSIKVVPSVLCIFHGENVEVFGGWTPPKSWDVQTDLPYLGPTDLGFELLIFALAFDCETLSRESERKGPTTAPLHHTFIRISLISSGSVDPLPSSTLVMVCALLKRLIYMPLPLPSFS
ncbi:unnamed protein product [Sphenostylis stenocarpa]|uniref:Uncharacterized protein n=1 Tax=Sphenostylis stenocarpa TaxID=92480 RepID=A0AA86VMI4_9FABA|nr:unnamed protein product [Sphenostylis stenocarpa]